MPPTQAQSSGKPSTQIQNAPHLPHLLLDDTINIANNAVQDGVNGMEEFLQKWADERVAQASAGGGGRKDTNQAHDQDLEATTHEVEHGLVAFQTLLEYHTDIAFDFFEAWCIRNSFMIPHELGGFIVLPHQEGLDLSTPLATIPTRFLQMYHALASSSLASTCSIPLPSGAAGSGSGKSEWETGKTGYVNWALGRLLVKGQEQGHSPSPSSSQCDSGAQDLGQGVGEGHTPVAKLDRAATSVGSGEEIRAAHEVVAGTRRELDGEPARAGRRRVVVEADEEEGESRIRGEEGEGEEEESMDVE
ncbi:hypothetical protein GALMADRAFT_267650 [Galerina marginata CBS 339.88]|uniref:Uncharacterized protein n=1 Tax=Galerina marginata (strain CBS 339.88) TaxID=685588 RepID=A0A067T9T8_GALM3|nr:hypothetical protein GALMADRAFT_267650 [Galerina marginata CBS 339.88]